MIFRIDEFAALVHPRDGHEKIFAMLEAYLDEAGIHDEAAICVIAGYFGGHGKWRDFEIDWKGMLAEFQVPMREFHAKWLFPKPTGFFRHKWKGDHARLLDAAASTIARHPKIHPICIGISVPAFNALPEIKRRYFTGADVNENSQLVSTGCPTKPYFVPFQRCVVKVCDYAPVGGKAHFFFGTSRQLGEYAVTLMNEIQNSEHVIDEIPGLRSRWKDRIGTTSFPLAKETPQLQAADFLASLAYHHILNAGNEITTAQPSPLLAKCIKNCRDKSDFLFIDGPALEADLNIAREVSARVKAYRAREGA